MVLRFALEARGVRTYSIMRWDAPLLGCILAVRPLRVNRVIALASVAVLAFYVIHLPSPLRPVDYTLATLACGLVITRAADVPALRGRALRHLGQISYGLYLWHFMLLQFGLPTVLAVGLAVVAAELSYRFVERPILSRGGSARSTALAPAEAAVGGTHLEGEGGGGDAGEGGAGGNRRAGGGGGDGDPGQRGNRPHAA